MKRDFQAPVVGRSIGRQTSALEFGKYPISARMGPRYLAACLAVARVIDTGQSSITDLQAISEMKGMYNRVLRHDTPDWESVRHLLGEPDRAVCNLAANWLADLRAAVKADKSLAELLSKPVSRGIYKAAKRAADALTRARFYVREFDVPV